VTMLRIKDVAERTRFSAPTSRYHERVAAGLTS
jgi:hypothetical protein